MAFSIVRSDIVNLKVDAIVNAANSGLRAGGLVVDAGIRAAAGPRLDEALAEIGNGRTGDAVVTDSFDIPGCRYIIHVVGPVYQDGAHGEREQLRGCYSRILSLAREYKCRSLAIPAISTGANGFPGAEAYRIASACVRAFLLSLPEDEDMMVYYVLRDRESADLGEMADGTLEEFVSSDCRAEKKQSPKAFFSAAVRNEAAPRASVPFSRPREQLTNQTAAARPAAYAKQDLSFAQMCEWWCEQKGISKKEFYISSNINKAMFWNMKHHPEQIPRKANALACAVGLRLSYDETQDLLMRAGMTLSKYYELDEVVAGYIRRREYDIFAINEVLFERNLPLLGAV